MARKSKISQALYEVKLHLESGYSLTSREIADIGRQAGLSDRSARGLPSAIAHGRLTDIGCIVRMEGGKPGGVERRTNFFTQYTMPLEDTDFHIRTSKEG